MLFSSLMVWLALEGSEKLIRSVVATEADFGSRESVVSGMLVLCKLSPEVLGFKSKLVRKEAGRKYTITNKKGMSSA